MSRPAGPPPEARRPAAVAFDVNETLTDLAPLRAVFEEVGLGADHVRWWFAVLLRDGLALAAAGDAAAFKDLALVALDELAAALGAAVAPGAGSAVIEAFSAVPVRPDVAPALGRLRAAGVPALALTNGSGPLARRILAAGGVADGFAAVLSVEDVGHWKPRPEPYHQAARHAGVTPDRLALVAVHPWDVHGAAAAGLVTGWVNRHGGAYPTVFRPPSVEAADLDEVVAGLLDLGNA